jgi:hypothetical protein
MQNNTILAILSIVVILGTAGKLFFDGDPTTNPDIASLITQILIALGVIRSVDIAEKKTESGE